jgi:hypothetical protein
MTSVSMAVTELSAGGSPSPPVRRRDWRQWLADQATSGWLISLTLHLLMMLVLALWGFRGQGTGLGQQTLVFSTADGSAVDDAVFQLLEPEPELSERDEAAALQAMQLLQRSELPSGFAPPLSQVGLEAAAAERTERERAAEAESWRESLVSGELLRGGAVEGRRPQRRKELVARFGGSAETERAVELGLAWLAAHQHPTMGYWSLGFNGEPCQGRCTHPGETLDDSRARFPPQSVAATGLALLAFLGAGYTHEEGPYQREVLRGLYFLQQAMQLEPVAGRLPGLTAKYAMYEQGIATLALCEAYQLSRDDDLRDFAQRGLDFIAHAQLDRRRLGVRSADASGGSVDCGVAGDGDEKWPGCGADGLPQFDSAGRSFSRFSAIRWRSLLRLSHAGQTGWDDGDGAVDADVPRLGANRPAAAGRRQLCG